MSEESTLSFRGLCRYIHRLSKASKAGMKAALADCPKRHFPMLEGLLGCIRLHGQDGAVYISDLVQELHQPLPAISRTVRQMEQDGLVERFADPADRRKTLVRFTPKGYEACRQCEAALGTTFPVSWPGWSRNSWPDGSAARRADGSHSCGKRCAYHQTEGRTKP